MLYARALTLVRRFHDIPQARAAELLGISRSYISELEKGSKKPSIDVLERYARVFDLPLSQLLVFAEASARPGARDRARVFAAEKVLRMLEWIDDRSGGGPRR